MKPAHTALVYDRGFLTHDTGNNHPERPARVSRTMGMLESLPWFGTLERLRPVPADESSIVRVHAPEYLERARQRCAQGAGILDTPDVVVSTGSFDAAVLAAGSALSLADWVMGAPGRNGFALLRPPGHHAEQSFAMGFCLFNNAAIAARHFQNRYGLERIMILDWDVHHGNGTQHLFEEDPSVFYVSLHQYPFYPGTGAPWETGIGKGEGTTLNCPMKAGAGDAEYERAFRERIAPAVEAFKPDAIIVSAGFDAHEKDPLGGVCLSTGMFGWMTARVLEWADRYSRGRVLSLLEGGYHPRALAESVERHMAVLSGQQAE